MILIEFCIFARNIRVMRIGDFKFLGVPKRDVDLDTIGAFIEDDGTKRINFALYHQNALRRIEGKKDVVGKLVLPFDEPFNVIAKKCLNMDSMLFPSKFGNNFYRQIFSEKEYEAIEGFIAQFNDIVFLRDTLDLSVALSMHETEPEVRTLLGEHEYQLKYQSAQKDTTSDKEALAAEMQKRLEELPYFKLADYICAVPSSNPFMRDIIAGLDGFGFTDISDKVSWTNKNGSLKNVETAEEKLDMIQSWGLTFDADLDLKNKNVLLVDDMYYSGVTMQYIGMKMKESGAKRVFGMALVKSLGN